MTKGDMIIVACWLFVVVVFQQTFEKERQRTKIKHDKVVEILWKKYVWKSQRLRIYTDKVYKND